VDAHPYPRSTGPAGSPDKGNDPLFRVKYQVLNRTSAPHSGHIFCDGVTRIVQAAFTQKGA